MDAHPSVPSATLAPLLNSSGIGAIPDASFMLLTGQCTMFTPLSARISMSPDDSHIQWAASTPGPKIPIPSSKWILHIEYFSFISSSSAFVSSTWICIPMLSASACSLTLARNSRLQVFGACGPYIVVILPSAALFHCLAKRIPSLRSVSPFASSKSSIMPWESDALKPDSSTALAAWSM